jgi:hypothetical protein
MSLCVPLRLCVSAVPGFVGRCTTPRVERAREDLFTAEAQRRRGVQRRHIFYFEVAL